MLECPCCERVFKSQRSLQTHYQRQEDCYKYSLEQSTNINIEDGASHLKTDNTINMTEETFYPMDDEYYDTNNINEDAYSNIFIDQKSEHIHNGYETTIARDNMYQSNVELLYLLKKVNAPLYLYDEIYNWARNASISKQFDFATNHISSRKVTIQNLKKQFQLESSDPQIKTINLSGSGGTVNIVCHCFQSSFYSLLSDESLMKQENLLFNLEKPHISNTQFSCINDIHTGSVYKWYQKKLSLISDNEIACPIIFFIDRTHTDLNGRFTLEQVRYTLGIFNYQTRNNPRAWRTIGYINDPALINAKNTLEKVENYHHIISIILKDFIECQKLKFGWEIQTGEHTFNKVYFSIPVLFIIGDTEGHDKLAGRYTSRHKVARLCRYCDCPFSETDNPEYKFKYNDHTKMMKYISNGTPDQLQAISQHPINNAWEKVLFCDNKRGIFGAICGDILHCIQHGLYIYLLQILFDQKQIKEIVPNMLTGETNYLTGLKCVFSTIYSKRFDELARQYGKLLMHQSDRELPRTHFQTNYTSKTRKNSSEMTGILIVILIVFSSNEGLIEIDNKLHECKTSQFIHLIEIMLLLEVFCQSRHHRIKDVQNFKIFLPYVLNTYKDTLNRTQGCGMKLIKFHLPTHFADDILRFGSMQNFDTGIGESHHKTAAKKPAKSTQKRKETFEFQTATRQIENMAIDRAYYFTKNKLTDIAIIRKLNNDEIQLAKWFRYTYDTQHGLFLNKSKKKNLLKLIGLILVFTHN